MNYTPCHRVKAIKAYQKLEAETFMELKRKIDIKEND